MAHIKYFQVQTYVQTARESPNLNMDFLPFDNVMGVNSFTNRNLCKNEVLYMNHPYDEII